MTPAHVRNARGEGDLLRQQITDAAIALIDRGENASTLSLRAIARAAGISAPSIYAHFDGLDEIREAVLAQSFDELKLELERAAAETNTPARSLRASLAAYLRFGQAHPQRYAAMFSPNGYGPHAIAALDLLQEMLQSAVAAGESDSDDVRGDSWMLWAALHGMTTLQAPAHPGRRHLHWLDRPAMFETTVRRLARLTD